LLLQMPAKAVISQDPLFLVSSVDPNVLFNMSVETPMGGAAYNDQNDGGSCSGRPKVDGHNDGNVNDTVGICYFNTKTYLGYFDPKKCYTYNSGAGWYAPTGPTNALHECSGEFSGNFMNWASMTAMDMFVWTMTGGNRIDDGADDTTVVRRTRKQNNNNWFPRKLINASHNVAPSTVTPWADSKIYIHNNSFGVKFGTTFNGNQKGTFNSQVRVCDQSVGLEDNCIPYNSGAYYKPEGLVQENAESMRFAVTSYSNTGGNGIDGGVLRSNMKYVGTNMPDGSGNMIANTLAEINAEGTLNTNPNPSDASASGVSYSGVITYLNKFSDAGYKGNDPAG
jgi:type IV pilus assembly protein PilY1